MKLAIFGAAGRTGIPLVQQALEGGNDVVALVRTPSKLSIKNERLTMVQGDAAHLADVERAVQGADAVLSVLGHVKGSEPDILTQAIRNIITAMDKYDVKRLVSLSGASVYAPQDKPKLVNRLIKIYTQATTGSLLKQVTDTTYLRQAPLISN